MFRGMLLGTALGAVMAAVWVGIAYMTGWELGLMTVFVGGAVGGGVLYGVRGRGGIGVGVLAAVLTLMVSAAGRFVVVQMLVADYVEEQLAVTEEDCVLAVAGGIYEQYVEHEYDMTWNGEGEYPVEVMGAAHAKWGRMDGEERGAVRAGLEEEAQAAAAFAPVFGVIAFFFSFGVWGLVWTGLAMGTAFRIGCKHVEQDETGVVASVRSTERGRIEILAEVAPTPGEAGIFAALGRVEKAREEKERAA